MIGRTNVGGGAGLNFKVVGNPQPSNPVENTIWVDTDTPITSWVFSATEPGSSDVMALSIISGSPWYLSAPQSLSAGDVLSFEIPGNVSNTYEAINIADPTTGDEYFVRNSDGSACNAWVKGTKVSVVLSNDTNQLNGYGGNAKTAYIRSYGSYGMTEGMVWIATGTTSTVEFNALKKNGITVYPLGAKQYVSGAWVDKIAKIYQDSGWKSVLSTVYLFKSGEGSLVPFTKKLSGSGSGYACEITTSNITASSYVSDSEAGYVSFYTTNKVDLTGFSTLYFEVKVTKAWGDEEPTFGVASATIPASETGINKFVAKKIVGVSSRKTISVDITNIDSGYVGAWAVGNFIVYNIWYE